jgi:hypothetical protein
MSSSLITAASYLAGIEQERLDGLINHNRRAQLPLPQPVRKTLTTLATKTDTGEMMKEECRNDELKNQASAFHSSFIILHSAFPLCLPACRGDEVC